MEIKKWEKIKTDYLIQRPWLTARRDTVRLPDGTINPEYYILEYPDWVNVIALNAEGNFIMVEQYRHGLSDVFIELVAGVIETGETPIEAAKRELLEETGYGNGEWELLTVISQNPASTNNLTYCFLAKNVVKVSNQKLDITEDIAIRILSPQQVLDLLMNDSLKQSLMAVPLWKYFYLNKK